MAIDYVKKNLIATFETNFKESFSQKALTDYLTNESFTYGDIAREIARLHKIFALAGLEKGDKVALMGADSIRWCVIFLATITYGAVIVPILQDFSPVDAENIIDHSESKLLFLDKNLIQKINYQARPLIEATFSQENLSPVWFRKEQVQEGFSAFVFDSSNFTEASIHYSEIPNDNLMLINYTSGTTGNSKGVLISGQNLAGNVFYARKMGVFVKGDNMLCFLPLAHTYSCAFNFLVPLTIGSHVTILGKVPSPKIVMEAFLKVKPNLIIAVPLILEKIYKQAILPKISEKKVRLLLQVPFLRRLIYKSINNKLSKNLGGSFREVVVGGAAMTPEVAQFLKKIGFPLTIGYGMTECAPLICYEGHKKWVLESCGKPLDTMEVRIDSDGVNPLGEIQVRGVNVCMGYFKNEEANKNLFTEDGWMRTGDLGTKDKNNNVFIKGRSKTMILSSNGQNIYPEEIESKINISPLVSESLVLKDGHRLVAYIVPNEQEIEKQSLSKEEAWQSIEAYRRVLNDQVGSYEKVTRFILQEKPFEKTPKGSIKRFLYGK